MQTKRRGPLSIAVFLALVAGGVMAIPSASPGAPTPPPPMMPCIRAGGKCLQTGDERGGSENSPGDRGGDGNSDPAPRDPSDDGGGGDDGGPRQPSPEEIARQQQQQLLIEAETFLPQPEADTSPGAGRPSVIDVPTFFAVSNWLPQQVDHYTNGPWWITVTATPSLSVDPGEPGAPTVQCEDGGTRFDPNGASPDQQAARPGACAHSYTRRTGVAGRPDAWSARVMVSWDVEWVANFSLPGDLVTFEVMTTTVEREVDEINSVVNRRG